MATNSDEYLIGWDNHANNFSISFNDLLQNKEFIDVTLAADGYLIEAHRLVLSALSPYFRRMFTQMSANQQAFGKISYFFFNYPTKTKNLKFNF